MAEAPFPHNESDRLAALRALDILDTPQEEAFDRITRAVASYLDVPICLISLIDSDRQWFKSRHGLDATETSRDIAFCSHAILEPKPFVIADTALDERFSENPLVTGEPNIQFYAGIPLALEEDIHLGTLCIVDHKPRELTPEQLEFLNDLANVVVDQFKLRQAVSLLSAADVQREAYSRDLEAQVLKTETILNTVADGIITIDAKGIVQSFNPAAGKVFGFRPEQVIGENIKILMPNPYKSKHDSYLDSYHETGRGQVIGYDRELVGQHADGTRFPIELTVSEMIINGEKMFTGIVRDISQKQKMLFQIESARAQAEKANMAKSAFLTGMSHELRTPLNAVLGFSQILLTDPECPLNEDQAESVTQISQAGSYLLELINDVLDLSRIEAGKVDLETVSVECKAILDQCYDLIAPQAANAELTFVLGKVDDCAVLADEISLKQVLLNLLSNAVKYNRVNGQITVSAEILSDKEVGFTVSDTGVGIPEGRSNELFQAFNRLGAERSEIQGTGVGLVITQELVGLMGGTIDFSSTEGVGTSFTVLLPRAI